MYNLSFWIMHIQFIIFTNKYAYVAFIMLIAATMRTFYYIDLFNIIENGKLGVRESIVHMRGSGPWGSSGGSGSGGPPPGGGPEPPGGPDEGLMERLLIAFQNNEHRDLSEWIKDTSSDGKVVIDPDYNTWTKEDLKARFEELYEENKKHRRELRKDLITVRSNILQGLKLLPEDQWALQRANLRYAENVLKVLEDERNSIPNRTLYKNKVAYDTAASKCETWHFYSSMQQKGNILAKLYNNNKIHYVFIEDHGHQNVQNSQILREIGNNNRQLKSVVSVLQENFEEYKK